MYISKIQLHHHVGFRILYNPPDQLTTTTTINWVTGQLTPQQSPCNPPSPPAPATGPATNQKCIDQECIKQEYLN